jgi:glycerophosphoryl diester phosphodiesterase
MSAHLIYQLSPPIVFGHRGASKVAPENTLNSFEKAFRAGAPAIELDAMLSSDQKIIVIHDYKVDRTTNGHGLVKELTLNELKKLDAGTRFSPHFKNERIPSLEDVFDLAKKDYLINIELKNYASSRDNLVEKVIELVTKRKMTDCVIFSSFLLKNIIKVRRYLPGIPSALLVYEGIVGKLEISPFLRCLSPMFIHPEYHLVDEKFIQNAHAHNRKVNTWTVDDKKDLERFVKANVDGIITNDPGLALQVKKSYMSI